MIAARDVWADVALPRLEIDAPASAGGGAQPFPLDRRLRRSALLSLSRSSASGCASARTAVTSTAGSRWPSTLALFADLHYVLSPLRSSDYVLPSDFLRLLAFGVLLAGVWRAIGHAEFGRAVAEERARVARDIHDGLAQYLFAISTQVSMLESGAALETILPRLKYASTAAQQEAQFAVLALSSASARRRSTRRSAATSTSSSPTASSTSSWRSTADATRARRADRGVPDRAGGARERAQARRRHERAVVSIVQRNGRRVVVVSDDGTGFDDGRVRRRPGPEEHALARRLDRGRASAAVVAREAARRSRSCCGR